MLPQIFQKLLNKYELGELFFTRGPGSFMAIKITYLFLRTIQIAENIPLFACDGFEFNKNGAIKAVGNLYFIKEDGKISTKIFKQIPEVEFVLPKVLDRTKFCSECEPLYYLPAI